MTFTSSFLFPEYRQKILALLLLHPTNHYHVREIARLTNTAAGSLHRELAKLANAQVLLRKVSGNQVYYQANTNFPIFEELASILRKTSGLVDILLDVLDPLTDKITEAFIFGSVARKTESTGNDVDVLLIGTLSFAEAATALYPAQAVIGREINPKVYSKAEWQKLVNNKDPFIQEILSGPKIFIKGTLDDIK